MNKTHDYKIPSLNGGGEVIRYDTFQDASNAVDGVIAASKDAIESGWLSTPALSKNKFNIENRIKFFLDCLGYLLLQAAHLANQSNGVISLYKESAKREREVPHDFSGEAPPPSLLRTDSEQDIKVKPVKPKTKTKSYRIRKLKEFYGSEARFAFARVDTDNNFCHDGYCWHIDQDIEQYKPTVLKDDVLWDMDQVMIVDTADGRYYYDMNYEPIPSEAITLC